MHSPIIEALGPAGSLAEAIKTPGRTVTGPNEALATHECRQVQGLAALARAGIPPHLTGSRCANASHGLRGDILDLELAGLKPSVYEEVISACELVRVGEGAGLKIAKTLRQLFTGFGSASDPEAGFALK
jgi:hypothetical protein